MECKRGCSGQATVLWQSGVGLQRSALAVAHQEEAAMVDDVWRYCTLLWLMLRRCFHHSAVEAEGVSVIVRDLCELKGVVGVGVCCFCF